MRTYGRRNHSLLMEHGMTMGGWHALRYSEGRAATTPFAALRACHPGCENCTGYCCVVSYTKANGRSGEPVAPRNFSGMATNAKVERRSRANFSGFTFSMM